MYNSTFQQLPRVLAVLCLACLCGATVNGQGCTNASYYGTSVFQLQGTTPAILTFVPYSAIGVEMSDGNGNVTGTYTDSTNGTPGGGSYSGTYTIASDCSGNETVTIKPSIGSQFTTSSTFQISAGGRTGLNAKSTSGYVMSGQSYRDAAQGSAQCSAASLAGGYDFLTSGTIQGSPVTKVGQLTLNDNGGVRFNATLNLQSASGTTLNTGTGSFSVAANCAGTITINRDDGFTDIFDFVVEQGGGLLLLEPDNTENTVGRAEPQVTNTVMGQFAFGGGWYSAIYFNNNSPGAVSFTVNFIGDDGNPLTVAALGGTSKTVDVPAGGTAIIEAPNSSTTLSQGYAVFNLPPGVTGYGVFRWTVGGRDQEAVVPFSPSTATASTLMFDATNGLVTGIAIVNPSPIANTVHVLALDNTGATLGTTNIALAANGKSENTLSAMQGMSGITGHRGKVVFTVGSGSVAVLGLRADLLALTSIPAEQ